MAKLKCDCGHSFEPEVKYSHFVICGDSTDVDVVDLLMGDERAKMAWTDPPYNVDYGVSKNPRHKIRAIEGDKQTADEWESFVLSFGKLLKKHCEGDVYIWGASGPDGMRMRLLLIEKLGLHWSATIAWVKQQLILTPANYQRQYELMLYGWFGDRSSYVGDRKQTEVWHIDRPLNSPEHPTMKPLETAERAVLNSSRKGDVVLDLFLGSGTCLVACEKLGRQCYGVEVVPAYVSVTLERWMQATGRSPELLARDKEVLALDPSLMANGVVGY